MKLIQNFKGIALGFFLVLALLVLAACGGGSDSASSNGNNASEGGKEDSEKVYHLRMNSVNAPSIEGTPQTIAEKGFAELVKEKTNGRIEIEIFYSNQLAGQSESLDALARGTIDLQVNAPAAWGDKIPEANWSNMPFAWKTEEELDHLIRHTEFGELFAESLEQYGVKPLHYYYSSSAGYLSNSPITKPEDFKGLVMNSSSNLKSKFYQEMGSGIANIPYAEYYEGLLRGTVDVVNFPYYAMETMKLSEVVKYVTIPGEVAPAPTLIAISKATWDELPSDLQELLMEAALEIEQQTIAASKEFTERGIQYARDEGLEIVEITDEGYKEFIEIAKKSHWAEYAASSERSKKMIEILNGNIGN
ncbi:TRAP transporter substrate-binding protein [Bacillus dakarensis]|uniref:TRAP transporter substrate-binding protein n=1 Tax=Robertmurraya dakarensis TaxID=1926278 RepID=UPI00098268DB|nr:TRAP transporter substrate-binding protein [Bacillus dakarensis]